MELKLEEWPINTNIPILHQIQGWKPLLLSKFRELNEHIHSFIVSTVCRDYFIHQIQYMTNSTIVGGCGLVITCELPSLRNDIGSKQMLMEIKYAFCLMLQELLVLHRHEWIFLTELFGADMFQILFILWSVEFNPHLNTCMDQEDLSQLKDYFANKDV